MVIEQTSLTKVVNELRPAIALIEERLAKVELRLEALKSLVEKQEQHLERLRKEAVVVSLSEYRDMRLKYRQHRTSISEATAAINAMRQELKARKKHLAPTTKRLAELNTVLSNRGKLLHLQEVLHDR